MKKNLPRSIVLAFLIVLSCIGTEAAEQNTSEISANRQALYAQGLDLVSLISEMTSSDSYSFIYGASTNEDLANVMDSIRKQDHTVPSDVFEIRTDLQELVVNMASDQSIQISERLMDYLRKRIVISIPSMLNAKMGYEQAAVASMASAGKTFLEEGLSESMSFLYVFEDAFPVMVSFVPGENSTISANASFVLDERFSTTEPKEIEDLINESGIPAHVSELILADEEAAKKQKITDKQALSSTLKYCYISNPELENIVNTGEYPVYWELSSSDEHEIVILYRSYTGAQKRYHIDPVSGYTYVTEWIPGISSEEERTDESFNVRDYLD